MENKSTVIEKIHFKNGLLHVKFTHGASYVYAGVPEHTVQDFINADSKGKFFRANIMGRYADIKVN